METHRIDAVELPMPPDTLIAVGMVADVTEHGLDLPIEGISIALCPRRDPAAEDGGEWGEAPSAEAFAVAVWQIEAALLPYAVFSFGRCWAYGSQITAVRDNARSEP